MIRVYGVIKKQGFCKNYPNCAFSRTVSAYYGNEIAAVDCKRKGVKRSFGINGTLHENFRNVIYR